MPAGLHLLAEQRAWLTASLAKFRAYRLFMPAAREGVALDIANDAIAESNAIAQAAHRAETNDLEAARILGDALADGKLTAEELPQIETALRLVRKSAEQDHDIAERAEVVP